MDVWTLNSTSTLNKKKITSQFFLFLFQAKNIKNTIQKYFT